MSAILMDHGAPRMAPGALARGWTRRVRQMRHWLARARLRGSIAHLDERLRIDAGFDPRDVTGFERLLRRYGAGGDLWGDRIGR